jgi:LEA14-like dessication related protein
MRREQRYEGDVIRARTALLLALLLPACSKPKPVQVTPRSVQVAAIRPQGVELQVVLNVYNPNGFAITASDVKGTLQLEDGTELGRGTAATSIAVPAEQTDAVPARMSMGWTNVAALAPFALSGQALPYRIVGSARIGGEHLNVELPFTVSGSLTREQVVQAGLRGAGAL